MRYPVTGGAARVAGAGWRAGVVTAVVDGVRELYPGYFALVMATGICSTALRGVGQPAASAVLLVLAAGCFAVLLAALGLRVARHPRLVARDLAAPDRAFAFFTVVAAADVLAARVAADAHRALGMVLAGFAAVVWLGLSYTIPVRLVLGPRTQPVLAGVNGTWFVWVVGTQSLAVGLAALDRPTGGYARPAALLAVLMWSVGVVLYLVVATLVVARLLLLQVRPQDLTPPYWVTMGATAITVLAAAQTLTMAPAPAVVATRPVMAGLAVVFWAFGTWLIPLLVTFGLWRHLLHRQPLAYQPALWSIVFPLGMYAQASMRLGSAAQLPIVEHIGRAWTWLAVGVWLVVFVGMCLALTRRAWRHLHPPSAAAAPAVRQPV